MDSKSAGNADYEAASATVDAESTVVCRHHSRGPSANTSASTADTDPWRGGTARRSCGRCIQINGRGPGHRTARGPGAGRANSGTWAGIGRCGSSTGRVRPGDGGMAAGHSSTSR